MALHLITGYKGEAHISAEDVGAFNAGVVGKGEYVFATGNQFKAELVSNNIIKILDGDLMIQGRHASLRSGTSEEITINNGEVGKNRIDILVARYTRDSQSGVEDVSFVVVQGVAASGTASDPELISGNILSGNCLIHDMPLYRIRISGLTAAEPEKLFKTMMGYSNLIVTSTYKGDGTESMFVDLGFTPDAVYVARSDGSVARTNHEGGYGSRFYGGLALKGKPCTFWDGTTDHDIIKIVENGFTVHNKAKAGTSSGSGSASIETNQKSTYYYVAFNLTGG